MSISKRVPLRHQCRAHYSRHAGARTVIDGHQRCVDAFRIVYQRAVCWQHQHARQFGIVAHDVLSERFLKQPPREHRQDSGGQRQRDPGQWHATLEMRQASERAGVLVRHGGVDAASTGRPGGPSTRSTTGRRTSGADAGGLNCGRANMHCSSDGDVYVTKAPQPEREPTDLKGNGRASVLPQLTLRGVNRGGAWRRYWSLPRTAGDSNSRGGPTAGARAALHWDLAPEHPAAPPSWRLRLSMGRATPYFPGRSLL